MSNMAWPRLGAGWTRPCQGVPGHRHGHLPGAQLVEGVALGRVTLAQVVGERPDVTGVTAGQGFEGTPGAHGVELAVVAHDDRPAPAAATAPSSLAMSASGVMPVSSRAQRARSEHVTARGPGAK